MILGIIHTISNGFTKCIQKEAKMDKGSIITFHGTFKADVLQNDVECGCKMVDASWYYSNHVCFLHIHVNQYNCFRRK